MNDNRGPIGVIAVMGILLIMCGGWAYRLLQYPPTMRYLKKTPTS